MSWLINLPIDTLDSKMTYKGNFVKDINKDLKLAIEKRDFIAVQHLSLELHISGPKSFLKWFQLALEYYVYRININNIYIIPHIYNFIKYWCSIDDDVKKKHPLEIVNDQVIRNYIFFMNWVICNNEISTENKKFKILPMDSADLNFKEMRESGFIISKNLFHINQFIDSNDPREILLPLSEICEILQRQNNNTEKEKENSIINLVYWFSWLLYYERTFHKGNWLVQPRNFTYLDEKYRNHWIAIFLEILIHYSSQYPVLVKKYILYLIHSYCILYNSKNKRTFAPLILMVFKLLIYPYNLPHIDQELFSKAYAYSLQCNFHYTIK